MLPPYNIHLLLYIIYLLLSNESGGGEFSWLRHWDGDPGDSGMNPITPITFSCAAIHFLTVYNLQHHQRPIPVIRCLYGVGG